MNLAVSKWEEKVVSFRSPTKCPALKIPENPDPGALPGTGNPAHLVCIADPARFGNKFTDDELVHRAADHIR